CNSPPFFFNASSTTYIYTFSLHDALPIFDPDLRDHVDGIPLAHPSRADADGGMPIHALTHVTLLARRIRRSRSPCRPASVHDQRDRKSTRLNSSHVAISYAVFCLKKKTLH